MIEMFHDGECPLCRREVSLLQRLDKRGRIKFTDIAAPDFDASSFGMTQGIFNAEIHGRLPDGAWLTGVDVFRRLYEAVGVTWLVRLSRLPLVSQGLDVAYRVFARRRLRLTGRCSPSGCVVERKSGQEPQARLAGSVRLGSLAAKRSRSVRSDRSGRGCFSKR